MDGPSVRADVDRQWRTGEPEIIYAAGKTPEMTSAAFEAMADAGVRPIIASRCGDQHVAAVTQRFPAVRHLRDAQLLVMDGLEPDSESEPPIVIVTGGTSDLPVAKECRGVLHALGVPTRLVPDIGVANLRRVLDAQEVLASARVIVVIAGMEAALGSVVSGLVAAPVVGVPTSVGYGVAEGGTAALHGLLASCAPGLSVVNIDNGVGAALVARRILGTSIATVHRQSGPVR